MTAATSPAPARPARTTRTWDSQGVATGGAVASGEFRLLYVAGVNNSGSTRYIQFFDATSVPADAAVPKYAPIAVAAGLSFVLDASTCGGLPFATGISWASSSTLATKTITGAADVWLTATFE